LAASNHRRTTWFLPAVALTAMLLGPALSHASDVKFGTEPLATNEAGKISDAGRKAATEQLDSTPGEEVWPIHVWAQIDNGGPGPLYVEFFGKLPDGKPYLTYRHEHSGYSGEKYVSLSFELTGNLGFNKGKTYNVKVLQVSPKGKDIVFATGKVTLAYTAAKPEEDEDDEGGEEEGGKEEGGADQDAIDTLTPEGGGGDDAGPPPVDSKGKKGCSIHTGHPPLGAMLLLFAAGALRRTNRRGRSRSRAGC
jgi:hypothetical protein